MFGLFKSRRKKEEEFMLKMMSAAAEGEQRAKINAALGSLDVQIEPIEDNAQYCIKTSALIVKKIVEGYGTDLTKADDDDIITMGLFLFAVSNHITRVIGAPFEEVSAITLLELFSDVRPSEEMTNYIPIVIDTYNSAATDSKIVDAIGQNFVKWLNEQTHSQFEKLIVLYKMCRENIKDA